MTGGWVDRLATRADPASGVDIALRIALAKEDNARAAWAAFERTVDLDALQGVEMCLVGLAAARLATLAPASPLRGRIGGIARANWSRLQLMIREGAPALARLAGDGIPVLVLGDTAREASGDPAGRGRPVGGLDLAVPRAELARARGRLIAEGWHLTDGPVAGDARTRGRALAFRRGLCGLDLRTSDALFDARVGGAEDGVWRRSRPASLAGVAVRVASPADALAIAVADGVRRSCFNGLWLAEVALAGAGEIDWSLFEEASSRHGLDAVSFLALRYARARLDRAVPADTLARLREKAAARPLHMLALAAECRAAAGTGLAARYIAGAARRLRRATGPVDGACVDL